MRRLIRWFVLLAVLSATSLTAAQETPTVILTSENAGRTASANTGNVIEIRLPIPNLYVNYDPSALQFLSYSGPDVGASGGVSTGNVSPDQTPGNVSPSGESGALPPVAVGAPGQAGGAPPANGTISGGEATAEAGAAVSGVGVAQPGVVSSGEPSLAVWQFRAIAAGPTTLEFHNVVPPCRQGQPCPMMPVMSIRFSLEISGDPITLQPADGVGQIVNADSADQTIDVPTGQIVALAVSGRLLSVQYNPAEVEYLPGGDEPRFRVLGAGVNTYVKAVGAAGGFGVYLNVAAACDSCGVMVPIPVEKVEAQVQSNPPGLSLTISFEGPSSCSTPIQFQETRNGNQISVVMYRDGGGICTMDLGQQTVIYTVQSALESGSYTVDVNGYALTVQV